MIQIKNAVHNANGKPFKCMHGVKTLPFLLACFFMVLISGVYAESAMVSQTKIKLQELENKITKLQQTLAHAQDKQGVLNHELADTEKKIGEGVRQLRIIQHDVSRNQQKISGLQIQVAKLSQQLLEQQLLLAKHLRTRYKMGEYQPLKWALNQDNPYTINRLLTFYQYLIKSRQQMITQVHETKNTLMLSKDQLNNEVITQQELQQQLTGRQEKFEQDKLYHRELIRSLGQDISTNQQTLEEYKRNKANLSRLLKSLVQQSVVQPRYPFIQMRHKLPRPVQSDGKAVEKMNQGVTFFAKEGDPVTAVYTGKVVFSDWLKGYGLLLIVDHGWGFMTLYAHNQSLFKQKGETVMQGEQIATIGHSGGLKQNGLYFEVRHRGKAIPPLEWLA